MLPFVKLCRKSASVPWILLWWSVAVCVVLTAVPSPLSARVVEKIIVVVNGEPYTFSDFQNFSRTQLGRSVVLEELARGQIGKEALEEFITEQLIHAEVKRMGIQVGDLDVDAYVERVMARSNLSGAELRAALRREGLDMNAYREKVRTQLERGELVERNVKKKVHITPEDVRRYYDANQKNYSTGAKVHLRHILLRVESGASPAEERAVLARTVDLRQRALNGENFAELARDYSEGAGAFDGGDIGWVDRDTLLSELAQAAFSLGEGEISQPVRTTLGFHLVKLEGRRTASKLPFDQVSGRIREELYAKALQERFEKWLKTDLRHKHRVEVKLPGYVFRAEKPQRGTVDQLMASASRSNEPQEEERTFLSYLNPLSYIVDEKPLHDDELGELSDTKIVSLFGVPLFATEEGDDTDVPLDQPFDSESSEEKAPEASSSGSSGASESPSSNWPF